MTAEIQSLDCSGSHDKDGEQAHFSGRRVARYVCIFGSVPRRR
jgi:hypothetical protein